MIGDHHDFGCGISISLIELLHGVCTMDVTLSTTSILQWCGKAPVALQVVFATLMIRIKFASSTAFSVFCMAQVCFTGVW